MRIVVLENPIIAGPYTIVQCCGEVGVEASAPRSGPDDRADGCAVAVGVESGPCHSGRMVGLDRTQEINRSSGLRVTQNKGGSRDSEESSEEGSAGHIGTRGLQSANPHLEKNVALPGGL